MHGMPSCITYATWRPLVLSQRDDDFAAIKRFVGSASVGLVKPCNELFSGVHAMKEYFHIIIDHLRRSLTLQQHCTK